MPAILFARPLACVTPPCRSRGRSRLWDEVAASLNDQVAHVAKHRAPHCFIVRVRPFAGLSFITSKWDSRPHSGATHVVVLHFRRCLCDKRVLSGTSPSICIIKIVQRDDMSPSKNRSRYLHVAASCTSSATARHHDYFRCAIHFGVAAMCDRCVLGIPLSQEHIHGAPRGVCCLP